MPDILRGLKLSEISLVDRPANPHARVLIAKAASDDDLECSECGEDLEDGDQFCGQCGAPAPPEDGMDRCRLCGEEVDEDARYCPQCGVHFYKADGQPTGDLRKAALSAASRNALPDSSFAAVWTDSEGNKQRALPIHDASHVRAALGGHGISATKGMPQAVKAKAEKKIQAAAKKFGIDVAKAGSKCPSCGDPIMHKNAAFCPGCGAKVAKSEEPSMLEVPKIDLAKQTPEVKAVIEALTKNLEELKAASVKKDAKPEDDVIKSLSPEQRALFEKGEVERKQDRERIAKLEDENLTREFTKRAEGLPNIGETRDQLATLLKHASQDLDKEDFDVLEKVLKAANAQVEKAGFFSIRGSSRSDLGGSVYDRVKAMAKEKIAKGEFKGKLQAAIDEVWKEHPELQAEHREEQLSGRTGGARATH